MAAGSLLVPEIPSSGFDRRKGVIAGGLTFLTSVYLVSFYLLKESGSYLKPAEEYCQRSTDEICSRPDLFAFQIVSGIMMFYMGLTGFYSWHISKKAHTDAPQTPEGRLYGYLEDADKLNVAIFIFQVWDFFASLFIPEHSTPIFLLHHVLTAATAWFSLKHQYFHYYAVYFGGCCEFSSIFLVFCDLAKFFPPTPGTPFDSFIFSCQVSFTLTFFCYRVIGWWRVSLQLWKDVFYVLRKGVAEKYRPGKQSYFVYFFMATDFILGILQVYWFYLVMLKVMEVLSGS